MLKDLKIRWKEKSTHSQQDYKKSTKECVFLVGQSPAKVPFFVLLLWKRAGNMDYATKIINVAKLFRSTMELIFLAYYKRTYNNYLKENRNLSLAKKNVFLYIIVSFLRVKSVPCCSK